MTTDRQNPKPKTQNLPPGIHPITSEFGPRPFSQYLLVGERSLLVDTGINSTPADVILPWMREHGFDPARLDYVLISHADVDHCGGNAAIREVAPDAVFMAGAADVPWIESREAILPERYGWYAEHGPDADYDEETKGLLAGGLGPDSPIDVRLVGGESIRLGPDLTVEVLALPGHSMGHLGLWEPESKTAIVIDAVLGAGLLNMDGVVIHPPPYFDAVAYTNTIRTVQELGPGLLLTAHYHPMEGEAAAGFLAESLGFVERTRTAVHDLFEREGEVTLAGALAALADELGPFTSFPNELAGPLRYHLNELVTEERATYETGGAVPRWVRTG